MRGLPEVALSKRPSPQRWLTLGRPEKSDTEEASDSDEVASDEVASDEVASDSDEVAEVASVDSISSVAGRKAHNVGRSRVPQTRSDTKRTLLTNSEGF